MQNYGEKLGVAFQLADDVIDLTSDGEATGKTPGTDLREGVATMPVLLLRRLVASPDASAGDSALLELLNSDLTSDEGLNQAVTQLRDHDVVSQTRELASQWANEAIAEIADLPAGVVKDALHSFATALVERAA